MTSNSIAASERYLINLFPSNERSVAYASHVFQCKVPISQQKRAKQRMRLDKTENETQSEFGAVLLQQWHTMIIFLDAILFLRCEKEIDLLVYSRRTRFHKLPRI